jgi:hypothetical protein
MQIISVQEQDDKTLKFEGTISDQEAAIVIAVGLNSMLHMGMMHMVPDIEVDEDSGEEQEETQLDLFDVNGVEPN